MRGWEEVGHQLQTAARGRLPLGTPGRAAKVFAQAMDEGRSLPDAVASARLPRPLGMLARAGVPPDLRPALLKVAGAMQAHAARMRVLRGAAAYAGWILVAALALWLTQGFLARPSLTLLTTLMDPGSRGINPWPWASHLAFGAGALGLSYLAVSQGLGRPLFPFSAFVRDSHRALALETAWAWTSGGASLQQSLLAAAAVCPDRRWRRDLSRLVDELERGGSWEAGRSALGDLGAGLLRQAASSGHHPVMLNALAAFSKRQVEARLPSVRVTAQLWPLGLGAVAVGAAAVSFYGAYVKTFTGGAF